MGENIEQKMQFFENLQDASEKLAEHLPSEQMQEENWLIVAISFHSIFMAEILAQKLKLDFDILFLEPIYSPNNQTDPIAMVSELEEIVMHENLINSFEVHEEYIYGEAHRKYEEQILKKVYKYKKGELIGLLEGKRVLLLDEGCETGLSALTAIKTAINAKAHSVFFAVPILPTNLQSHLETSVDDIFTLYHVDHFVDTDFYYENKEEIDDEEIKKMLESSKHYLAFKKETNTGEE